MKWFLKLLKDWTAPDGVEHKAGSVIEIEGEDVASKLLLDGTAVRVEEKAVKDDTVDKSELATAIGEIVAEKVAAAVGDATKDLATKHVTVELHDKSDDDPTHGYLEPKNRDYTEDELRFGLGKFAHDVYLSGDRFQNVPDRLSKSVERSHDMIAKAYGDGDTKAAGDGMQVRVDEEMGALIPPEFSSVLLDAAAVNAQIRPIARSIPIGTSQVVLPQVQDYDRSSKLVYGGMLAYWKGEDAQLTETKLKHEEVTLTLHALTALAYASHQAIKFAPFDLGGYLIPLMGNVITWKEEDGFINGTGAGMPQGVLAAGAKVAIAAESGQSSTADVVASENIDNMIARLKVENSGSVAFMYNRPDLYVWLCKLKRSVGTGGELARLFERRRAPSDTDMLDGIPALDNEHCAAAATEGDLILCDWSQYLIADDRSGAEIAQSMHLKFDYAQMAWRIIKYVDGQIRYKSAFTRQKSTNTVSPVLTIATR